jgi:hypothetical protein
MEPFAHLWFGIKFDGTEDVQALHESVIAGLTGDLRGEEGGGRLSIAVGDSGLIFSAEPLENEVAVADFVFVKQPERDVLVGWGIGLTKIYGETSLFDIMKGVETKQELSEIAMIELLSRVVEDPAKLEAILAKLDLYISPDYEE